MAMRTKPFFSIIVPIYNRQSSISECITSILNQSFSNFELILVNDGSTDKSEEVCKSFLTDSRIIYIQHSVNKGVVAARDTGIINANGEYITWVDSDDYIEENRLETLYQTILTENVDIVVTGYIHEFQNGKKRFFQDTYIPGVFKAEEYEKIKPHIFEFNSKTGMRNVHTILWNKAIKRELLQISCQRIPYTITIGDDTPRTYIALLAANSAAFIKDYSYHYIENPGQMMKTPYQKDYFEKSLAIYQLIDLINRERGLTPMDIGYEISQNIAITAVFAVLNLSQENDKKVKEEILSNICNNKTLRNHLTKELIKKQSFYFRILLNPIFDKKYRVLLLILYLYKLFVS